LSPVREQRQQWFVRRLWARFKPFAGQAYHQWDGFAAGLELAQRLDERVRALP